MSQVSTATRGTWPSLCPTFSLRFSSELSLALPASHRPAAPSPLGRRRGSCNTITNNNNNSHVGSSHHCSLLVCSIRCCRRSYHHHASTPSFLRVACVTVHHTGLPTLCNFHSPFSISPISSSCALRALLSYTILDPTTTSPRLVLSSSRRLSNHGEIERQRDRNKEKHR